MLFYVESVKDILGCDHSNEYAARHNFSYAPFITLHKAVLNSNSVDLICFAFRPQPALPRKLPSVYLVP